MVAVQNKSWNDSFLHSHLPFCISYFTLIFPFAAFSGRVILFYCEHSAGSDVRGEKTHWEMTLNTTPVPWRCPLCQQYSALIVLGSSQVADGGWWGLQAKCEVTTRAERERVLFVKRNKIRCCHASECAAWKSQRNYTCCFLSFVMQVFVF